VAEVTTLDCGTAGCDSRREVEMRVRVLGPAEAKLM
jgi:hypothetical protein